VVTVATALIVCAVIWEVFGRRQLRAQVELLKNV
jgi:hypothetical protein